MRKPGQIPLTRPAPFEEAEASGDLVENEYGVMVASDEPILWVRLNETGENPVMEKHYTGAGYISGDPGPIRNGGVSNGFTFDGNYDAVFFGCDVLTSVPPRVMNEAGVFSFDMLMDPSYVEEEGWFKIVRWGYYGFQVQAYRFVGEDTSGYLHVGFYDADGIWYTADYYDAALFVPGALRHYGATFDGTDLKIFVDGVVANSETHADIVPFWGFSDTSTDGLGIAADATSWALPYFKGTLAEVAIYNTVLSETRMLEHAEADRTPSLYNEAEVSAWPTPYEPPVASSFHLWWQGNDLGADTADPAVADRWTRSSVKLTIPTTPTVEQLYFWAMQVTFYDAGGSSVGGAHTGLMWNPLHPNSKAVNWGGYDAADEILTGTESSFPSATDNPNTRDYEWSTATEYTLAVFPVGEGYWRATINGDTIRDLYVPDAVYIGNMGMWSEIFADCSDPSHKVLWRDAYIEDGDENQFWIYEMMLTYQSDENGCPNTNSFIEDDYFAQQTNTTRINDADEYLSLLGFLRESFLNYSENVWPSPEFAATTLALENKVSVVPTASDFARPRWGFSLGFSDALGEGLDCFVELQFTYDPTKSVWKQFRAYGEIYDSGLDEYLGVPFTSSLPVVEVDGFYTFYEFMWAEATTYEWEITQSAPGEWTVSIDGTDVLEFEIADSASVGTFGFNSRHLTSCGENRLKVGWGNITAANDALETAQRTNVYTYINADDACPTLDYYLEDDVFFTIDSDSPDPRTFPEDVEAHLYLPGFEPPTEHVISGDWVSLASMPEATYELNGAATYIPSTNQIAVFGGFAAAATDTIKVYDIDTDTWETKTEVMPNAARQPKAVYEISSERIVVMRNNASWYTYTDFTDFTFNDFVTGSANVRSETAPVYDDSSARIFWTWPAFSGSEFQSYSYFDGYDAYDFYDDEVNGRRTYGAAGLWNGAYYMIGGVDKFGDPQDNISAVNINTQEPRVVTETVPPALRDANSPSSATDSLGIYIAGGLDGSNDGVTGVWAFWDGEIVALPDLPVGTTGGALVPTTEGLYYIGGNTGTLGSDRVADVYFLAWDV